MVTEIEKVCDWARPKTSEYTGCMESFKNCKLTSLKKKKKNFLKKLWPKLDARPLYWIFSLFQSFQEPSQSLSLQLVSDAERDRHTERERGREDDKGNIDIETDLFIRSSACPNWHWRDYIRSNDTCQHFQSCTEHWYTHGINEAP